MVSWDRTPGLEEAAAAVGDRWSLLVVDALRDGRCRFAELQSRVRGVAPNVLSSRLKRLEREGIVLSNPYSRRPLRMEYQLSSAGLELASAMRGFAAWGVGTRGKPVHPACGERLEIRWWCPRCAEPVEPETDQDLEWV